MNVTPDLKQRRARWNASRTALRLFRQADDLDAFAQWFISMYPDCPPDPFDYIASNGERFHNGGARKWAVTRQALEPTGWFTRLESQVSELVFISALPEHFGLRGENYLDKQLYHFPPIVNDFREAFIERIRPPYYWRLEVGVNGLVHPHILCDKGAFRGRGIRREIYEPLGLVRYLYKGIPYTAENLAAYLKARVALKLAGIWRGSVPNHSGTTGVPNARTWKRSSTSRSISPETLKLIGKYIRSNDVGKLTLERM